MLIHPSAVHEVAPIAKIVFIGPEMPCFLDFVLSVFGLISLR